MPSATAATGLQKALSGQYDLLLLDVMLPGRDGFAICDEVRKVDRDQPIIMLTAKTSDEDIVNGLALGADDYIAKPFSIAQLVLRVKAVLRRSRTACAAAAQIKLAGDVEIDMRNLSGRRGAEPLTFTRREMEILEYLQRNTRAARVARRAADARLGLRPLGRDRDAHRRHPYREAAAQDRARREGAAQPDHRARRGLPARGERVKRRCARRFDERALKLVLAAFFLALAVPAGVLIAQAYSQLKWQAFRSTQVAAEELAARIDAALRAAIAAEDARSFGAYSFLVVEGDAAANFVQRSPLSAFPVESAVPGVLGYFQVDAAGRLTTPLLPEAGVDAASYGIAPAEEAARAAARRGAARAARAQSARARAARRARRQLPRPGESAPLELERRQLSSTPASRRRSARPRKPGSTASRQRRRPRNRARCAVARRMPAGGRAKRAAEPPAAANAATVRRSFSKQRQNSFAESGRSASRKRSSPSRPSRRTLRRKPTRPRPKLEVSVRTFASEIDPFELGVLDTGHLVLFRNVWRDGQRYVQGALIDREAFVATAIEAPYRGAASRAPAISTWRSKAACSIGSSPTRARIARRPAISRARCCTARGCRRRSATSSSRSSSMRCRARRAPRCSPGSPSRWQPCSSAASF